MMNATLHANHRLGNPLPTQIVIVRSLPGLGDLLCAVPALRALRQALPAAEVTWIGLPGTGYFGDRFPHYITHWLDFPGYPGIPELAFSPSPVVNFLAAQQGRFDLALQMQGSGGVSNGFTLLLGARKTAGFKPPGLEGLGTGDFLPYPDQEPEIWRNLRLMDYLGIPLQGDHLEFPLESADWQALEAIAPARALRPGQYVCVHPGASTAARRWPHHCFAAVADGLAREGLSIVLTGTPAERPLTQAVAQAMQYPCINLAGKTSLGAIAALLSQAQLLISNDTGVSHLAAALQVNSVVIFSHSDPQRWAPLDRQRHRVVGGRMEESGPRQVEPQSVLAQARDLLRRRWAYAAG